MEGKVEIYSDGGARGNPGPGACAFVVKLNGKIIAHGSKYLGKVTNNYAEYQGVILAFDYLVNKSNLYQENIFIDFFMDSELVVKQLIGEYKTKNETLRKLNTKIRSIISVNKLQITFRNIPRAKNKEADLLVNRSLDEKHSL